MDLEIDVSRPMLSLPKLGISSALGWLCIIHTYKILWDNIKQVYNSTVKVEEWHNIKSNNTVSSLKQYIFAWNLNHLYDLSSHIRIQCIRIPSPQLNVQTWHYHRLWLREESGICSKSTLRSRSCGQFSQSPVKAPLAKEARTEEVLLVHWLRCNGCFFLSKQVHCSRLNMVIIARKLQRGKMYYLLFTLVNKT